GIGSLLVGVGDVGGSAAMSTLPSSETGSVGAESSGNGAAAGCTVAAGGGAGCAAMAASAGGSGGGGSVKPGGANPDAVIPGSNRGTDATVAGWRCHQSGTIRPAATSAGGVSSPSRKTARPHSREGHLPTETGREPIASPRRGKKVC